jgi:hypothetical protein
MLTFFDVYQQFSNHRGIQDDSLNFEVVSIFGDGNLQKGLFVPLHSDQSLKRGIECGAIAAIWPKDREIPFFTPNHLPVFKVDNPLLAFKSIIETYMNKIKQEECEKMTKFVFFSPELLNNEPFTYDLAVKEAGQELISVVNKYINRNGRG